MHDLIKVQTKLWFWSIMRLLEKVQY